MAREPVMGAFALALSALLMSAAAVAAAAAPGAAPPAPAASSMGSQQRGAAQSAPKTIEAALLKAGLTDCLKLIQSVPDAARHAANPKTAVTVFCPTNQAVAAFLKSMGITLAELAARPDLADKLVAYHVVPRTRASSEAPAGAAFGISGDPHYLLRFKPAGGGGTKGLAVRDAQGNSAAVVAADIDAGASVVHAVDRVLLSGEYFPTLKAFAAFYGGNFSTLAAAFDAAGLAPLLTSNTWEGTLFAPIEGAFEAGAKLLPELGRVKAGAAPGGAPRVKAVIEYAQLPEVRVYPADFQRGKPVATRLAGHAVTVSYSERNVTLKRRAPAAAAGAADAPPPPPARTATLLEGSVAPEAGSPGRPAAIGLPNVYVARGVVHGIDGVLLPALKAPAPEAPRGGGRRRLLRGGFGGGGGFRGAGGFRDDGAGFGGGGGGRAFDVHPDAGYFRPADRPLGPGAYGPRPGWDRGCCWGAGYAGAAFARPYWYGGGWGPVVQPTVVTGPTVVQQPSPVYYDDYEPPAPQQGASAYYSPQPGQPSCVNC